MSIRGDYQNTLKDVIKLQSNTRGGNGDELLKKMDKLRQLSACLPPQERAVLEQEAFKKASTEMKKDNDLMRSKDKKPKYHAPMMGVCGA